jgi:hypothetical protein
MTHNSLDLDFYNHFKADAYLTPYKKNIIRKGGSVLLTTDMIRSAGDKKMRYYIHLKGPNNLDS